MTHTVWSMLVAETFNITMADISQYNVAANIKKCLNSEIKNKNFVQISTVTKFI